MADSFWGSLVSMGMDMTGGILSAVLTKEQNAKQRNWSSAEAEKQRQFAHQERVGAQEWSRQMWNLNNLYNTPTAQMQRMMAAGINPNSAAGLVQAGDSSAPPASIAPAAGASAAMPAQFNEQEAIPSMLNATANYKAQLAQSKLAEAMTDKTREETTGLIIDNHFKPFEKQADIDRALQQIDLWVKQGELTEVQADQIRALTPALLGKSYAEINKLIVDADKVNKEVGMIDEQINLLKQQIETEKHRQSQMDAATYEAYMAGNEHKSAIELNGKRMSLTEAEARLKNLEGDRTSAETEWRRHCRYDLGYDPDSSNIDRLIDGTGSVITLLENKGMQLIDSVKLKMSSLTNPFSPR